MVEYKEHIQDCRDCPNCSHAECLHEAGHCNERNGCKCLGFVRANRIFMFTNGTVAVCDENGNQIPEFQGTWINFDYLRELAKTIRKDNSKTEGVLRLPSIVRETLFPEKPRKCTCNDSPHHELCGAVQDYPDSEG